MAPISISIIYNKANTYGLNDDIIVMERILKKMQDSFGPISKVKIVDMREPLTHSDINIHLEIPVFSAIPWAHTNILLVNPEQWSYAYDAYVHSFDALIFRDPVSAEKFRSDYIQMGISSNIYVVPWCNSWQVKDIKSYGDKNEFVCFIGGSTSKYEYIKNVLPYWTDIPLTVYTTRDDFADGLMKRISSDNITVKCEDLDVEARRNIMTQYRGHLVCSECEAFGYAAANAETAGAFSIMNLLPTFDHFYQTEGDSVAWLSNSYEESTKVRYSIAKPTSCIKEELVKAFDAFHKKDFYSMRNIRQETAKNRFDKTCNGFLPVLTTIVSFIKKRKKGIFHCPPILQKEDCPHITVITPTYNREKLIEIAFHNLLATDYPHNKIEWIVIEDNEEKDKMSSEKIISFQIQVPNIKLKYIPIEGRMTIGEKRNYAIEHASNDIILFMDDDDHYPETSFRRRVAWLTKGTKCGRTGFNIACCTTLALYDLTFGTSAVNVPPFDISFSQRISEATLTFRKSAWNERKFSDVSISEGEQWIYGREDQVIEMPPQQIIVAFSHNNNKSSRRIPPEKPACFWGFPKEYLLFIHGLVGTQVEEIKSN
jgi:hypothetical protein